MSLFRVWGWFGDIYEWVVRFRCCFFSRPSTLHVCVSFLGVFWQLFENFGFVKKYSEKFRFLKILETRGSKKFFCPKSVRNDTKTLDSRQKSFFERKFFFFPQGGFGPPRTMKFAQKCHFSLFWAVLTIYMNGLSIFSAVFFHARQLSTCV